MAIDIRQTGSEILVSGIQETIATRLSYKTNGHQVNFYSSQIFSQLWTTGMSH